MFNCPTAAGCIFAGWLARAQSCIGVDAPSNQAGASNLWPALVEHPNYDKYWQEKDIRRHLHGVNCAVLSVGGWYDAEDPLGPLSSFYETKARNPTNSEVTLVMGPWAHGQWSGGEGVTSLGNVCFFSRTEEYYREHIELPFFTRHLMPDKAVEPQPAAVVFEVGRRWLDPFGPFDPSDPFDLSS